MVIGFVVVAGYAVTLAADFGKAEDFAVKVATAAGMVSVLASADMNCWAHNLELESAVVATDKSEERVTLLVAHTMTPVLLKIFFPIEAALFCCPKRLARRPEVVREGMQTNESRIPLTILPTPDVATRLVHETGTYIYENNRKRKQTENKINKEGQSGQIASGAGMLAFAGLGARRMDPASPYGHTYTQIMALPLEDSSSP
ncbi:hypothetical protein FF38_14033 [Lucilia cuprina]|uniref:Uncharacterized protein n=1 Tax=Lucilia cuprina TaxID=7375 RepID=A0A0L0BPT6_LUCCU|nr:hypothetical protein FF38_14033 [Lucilia cuprina]